MTGSSSSQIDALVTAWNTGHQRRVIGVVQGDADLAAMINAEITRLETASARRNLLHPDYGDAVSKKLHDALVALKTASGA